MNAPIGQSSRRPLPATAWTCLALAVLCVYVASYGGAYIIAARYPATLSTVELFYAPLRVLPQPARQKLATYAWWCYRSWDADRMDLEVNAMMFDMED